MTTTSRQDRNLLGLPSKSVLVMRVGVAVIYAATFALVLVVGLYTGSWGLILSGVGGMLTAITIAYREIGMHRLEITLRRRLGHHAHRANLAEAQLKRTEAQLRRTDTGAR